MNGVLISVYAYVRGMHGRSQEGKLLLRGNVFPLTK